MKNIKLKNKNNIVYIILYQPVNLLDFFCFEIIDEDLHYFRGWKFKKNKQKEFISLAKINFNDSKLHEYNRIFNSKIDAKNYILMLKLQTKFEINIEE